MSMRLIGLCFLLGIGDATAADPPKTFQEAMDRAENYSVQFDDPESIQEGINRYYEVIAGFPKDPRVVEAKIGLLDILRSDAKNPSSLAQAAKLLRELLGGADLSTASGQDIAFRYLDFHLWESQGLPHQDLAHCRKVLDQLSESAKPAPRSLLALRTRHRVAMLHIREGDPTKGMSDCIDILGSANQWAQSGFWQEVFQKSPTDYRDYQTELNRIASTACVALLKATDDRAAALLRREEQILAQYEHLSKELKRYERNPKPAGTADAPDRPNLLLTWLMGLGLPMVICAIWYAWRRRKIT